VTAQAPALLKERDEISSKAGRSSQQGAERFFGFCHHMEKQMTKMTFVSAALIAATVFATQAMARNDSAARHATTRDCVRAPNVGAFATQPYTVPPCLPNTATDTFH
jgi:preprotein translocase subunit SecG